MTPSKPVAVLVDAYTTGNFLPPAFHRLGAEVVHVQSTPELMTSMLGPDLTAYRANVVHTEVADTASRLAEFGPACVVAGQEPGVPLSDALSEHIGLPTNGSALSSARRNKYDMIEALRAKGVRCAEQLRSGDPAELLAWAERRGEYPVVVKPLSSAATDGVAICHSPDEVLAAAKAVLATETIYNEANTEALIQSYLAGTEYVVDMVSCQGRRYTCGVWEYRKRLIGSTHNIYDTEAVLPSDAGPVPELIAYTNEALDALGIQYGPTHAEVILTEDGPTLVEVGARLAGNMHPAFHDQVVGGNQADLTALAYLRPDEFLADYAGRHYTKQREGMVYTAPTTSDGIVERVDEDVVAEIAALDTVFGVNVKIKPGGRIRPTVDLYTSTLR
ncbi:MAG TPA: ATP-grasp domain-containing protein, partial [Pseudonocardia sp.]